MVANQQNSSSSLPQKSRDFWQVKLARNILMEFGRNVPRLGQKLEQVGQAIAYAQESGFQANFERN